MTTSANANRFAGIVLAAGMSRRFGPRNKLLHTIEGEPMIRKVIEALQGGGVARLVVALGHQAEQVREALEGFKVEFAVNKNFADGMGGSIAAAASMARDRWPDSAGILVCPGDLPWLRSTDVTAVIDGFLAHGANLVAIPRYGEERGHPVCFPSRLLDDLSILRGAGGARTVVQREAKVAVITGVSVGCVRDIDTEGESLGRA